MELAKLLVPSIISIIGFVITIIVMNAQFKNAKKQKITDAQRQIYLDTYMAVEKIISANELIFDTDYYDSVLEHKGEMKLSASNNVIQEYSNYVEYIHSFAWPFWKWKSDNDPTGDASNYEIIVDEHSGKEDEICHITQDMMDSYEYACRRYKQEHMPDSQEVKSKVESLLNAMRKDLGNDTYKF